MVDMYMIIYHYHQVAQSSVYVVSITSLFHMIRGQTPGGKDPPFSDKKFLNFYNPTQSSISSIKKSTLINAFPTFQLPMNKKHAQNAHLKK